MRDKTTDQLVNEITEATDIVDFIKQNEDVLSVESFTAMLQRLLTEKGLSKSEVINAANLNQVYGYQIFSGLKNPSRDKAISLVFGLNLSLDEAQHLLRAASHKQLYAREQRDSLLIYAISKRFSFIQANELLFENHFDLIK